MIIVHVDDMLFPNLTSLASSANMTSKTKRADDDEGVLYCGKRVRTVPDDMKPGGLALQ